jgi:hypothetical protein
MEAPLIVALLALNMMIGDPKLGARDGFLPEFFIIYKD